MGGANEAGLSTTCGVVTVGTILGLTPIGGKSSSYRMVIILLTSIVSFANVAGVTTRSCVRLGTPDDLILGVCFLSEEIVELNMPALGMVSSPSFENTREKYGGGYLTSTIVGGD